MKSWFSRSTETLNADPVLRALVSSIVCACSALFLTITAMFLNDAVQHSMLRGRAYAEADFWVNTLIGADIGLVLAMIFFLNKSVRLSRPTKPAESFAELKDWDLEDVI